MSTVDGMHRPEYKNAVTAVYIAGLFIQILDSTVVNVALPSLADEFAVDVTDVEWVIVGFGLTLAAGIPAAGWFADRFGPKRVFLSAIVIFTFASMACGLASSLDQLVAARIAQGLGAGLITPVGSAMLYRAYPLHERAKAANTVLSVTVIAPAIGPTIGGLLIETVSWRAIFFVNVPIGALALVLGWLWLKPDEAKDPGHLDMAGLALSSGGLALGVYALSSGPDVGWLSARVLLAGLASIAALTALVQVERRVAEPVLALRLLTERLFRTCNLLGAFLYMGFVSQIFMLTLYLQRFRGYSALEAGLTSSSMPIGVLLFSNLVGGRLYQRVGPRRMLIVGTSGATVSTALFSLVGSVTPLPLIGGVMFVRGLFLGSVFLAIQAAVYVRVESVDLARAASLFNAQRQAATAIGVAVTATALAAFAPLGGVGAGSGAEGLAAYQSAFLVAGLMMAPAVLASTFIRDEDVAATRQAAS
ncbi:MAG: DHA2 family efflux MFS transporter permease subunit [Acidimicrobiales bacterium]|nr:DHA2 family efflux MFS transporter permease subunit [Acidimicrobiales bacterium]